MGLGLRGGMESSSHLTGVRGQKLPFGKGLLLGCFTSCHYFLSVLLSGMNKVLLKNANPMIEEILALTMECSAVIKKIKVDLCFLIWKDLLVILLGGKEKCRTA